MVANLAKKLAPIYGEAVTGELLAMAKEGYDACLRLGVKLEPTPFGATLPTGSGNDESGLGLGSHFYDDLDDSLKTENDGNILIDG